MCFWSSDGLCWLFQRHTDGVTEKKETISEGKQLSKNNGYFNCLYSKPEGLEEADPSWVKGKIKHISKTLEGSSPMPGHCATRSRDPRSRPAGCLTQQDATTVCEINPSQSDRDTR